MKKNNAKSESTFNIQVSKCVEKSRVSLRYVFSWNFFCFTGLSHIIHDYLGSLLGGPRSVTTYMYNDRTQHEIM